MPTLTVTLKEQERRIAFAPGRTVRDVLDETDIRVRAGCNGMGACGLCRIQVNDGNAGEPSVSELASLGAGLVSRGVRLACQVKADRDLRIAVLNPSPPSVWRCLDDGRTGARIPGGGRISRPPAERPLGAAIDLGTTHISITVSDLPAGRLLAGRRGLNPQAAHGSDVMTRLVSARSAERAEELSRRVIQAIGEGLRDIGSREGIDLGRLGRIVLVGNTAMLALLSGHNHLRLLQPRYWVEAIDCLPVETSSWGASWGLHPEAVIEVIPPLAGFVGSDLLSGILATRLLEHGPGALLVDFGTNSEMALWDGDKLWVTSAAGGPAFEGCGISCGMPADPGAICRVKDPDAAGALAFDVIGGTEPAGVCGSGMVDLLACLVRNGTLNRKGQFAPSVPEKGFPLRSASREIVLTKRDVDTFQRAKAAIGVALNVLLGKAGMEYRELRRICVGGVFGRYLDIVNAREIGLLPAIPEQCTETSGNTALAGCEALLLSPESGERLREARSRAILVNLSGCADFGTLFLEHLYLQPIAAV